MKMCSYAETNFICVISSSLADKSDFSCANAMGFLSSESLTDYFLKLHKAFLWPEA